MIEIKVDIDKCERCGKEHKSVQVRKFTVGALLDSAKEPFPYFAMCPELQEPLLMRFEDHAKGYGAGISTPSDLGSKLLMEIELEETKKETQDGIPPRKES